LFNRKIRENKKIVEKTTFMPLINHMTTSDGDMDKNSVIAIARNFATMI
jgi:hypothetical protein